MNIRLSSIPFFIAIVSSAVLANFNQKETTIRTQITSQSIANFVDESSSLLCVECFKVK